MNGSARSAVAPRARDRLRVDTSESEPRLASAATRELPSVVSSTGEPLAAWARARRAELAAALSIHGALLFRGFDIRDEAEFSAFAAAVSTTGPLPYGERSSPRSEIAGRVYTSTDHPPDQPIVLHNEQSYTLRWPTKIMFYSQVVAHRGGRTPIADSRKILARLSPETVRSFEQRQILYTRTYNTGLGLSWQTAFQTTLRSEVEAHCRRMHIEWQWLEADMLRTRQVRPAVRRHPISGERVWFNHALFFHVTSLAPALSEAIVRALPEQHYPTNTYFGDGEGFPPAVLSELKAAYHAETRAFDWQPGDVLLLDNMLTAHGREPFHGPRRVMTIMADDIEATSSGAPRDGNAP